jgi:hypothetical protein
MMNEETEQFERRLSRQPLRQIPHEWRGEILAAARDTQNRSSPVTRRSLPSTLNHQLLTILWPHPKAWAGLAAVWILIFAVDFSIRDKSPQVAEKVSPPSPEVVAELRQQKLLFAELIGSTEPLVADRQKLFLPRPRSERADILTA